MFGFVGYGGVESSEMSSGSDIGVDMIGKNCRMCGVVGRVVRDGEDCYSYGNG